MTVEFKHGRCKVPESTSKTQPGCVAQWLVGGAAGVDLVQVTNS